MRVLIVVLTLLSMPVFAADPHAQHRATAAMAADHGDSLFHLDAEWTDHRGDTLALDDLRGHPVILVMFYGNCTTACPILVQDAKRLDAALPDDVRADTRFVLVSFDTVNDTPERLRTVAGSHGIDDARWHFVRGERAQVRALAMLLGVQFHDNGDGTFDHSNLITVLDRDGRITHRVEGLMQPMDAAAAALAR